jgi:hypothetical protein
LIIPYQRVLLQHLSKNAVWYAFALFTGYLALNLFNAAFFSAPIIQDDYSLHYANSIEVLRHLLDRGAVWGYSPWYCAGRSAFGIDDIWSVPFLMLLGPLLGSAGAFNISIIVAFYIPPLASLVFMKCFGAGPKASVMAVTATMLAVVGMVPVRSFYYIGCYGFVLGSALCLLLLGIVKSFLEKPGVVSGMLLCLLGTASILVHPLSAVVFLILALPVLVIERKKLSIVSTAVIAGSGLIAVGVNLLWYLPYRANTPVETHVVNNMQTSSGYLIEVLTGNKTFLLLVVLFVLTVFRWYRTKQYASIAIWGSSVLAFALIAFRGTQLGLRNLEPNRFIIPLQFEMIVLVSREVFESGIFLKIPLRILSVVFMVLCFRPMPNYVFGFGEFPAAEALISNLKGNGGPEGRVLLQDSFGHPYFNCHFSALIPVLSGRETTANTYRGLPPKYPQFVEQSLFGTTLDRLTPDGLQEQLTLFDISHILVYSPDARAYFDSCGIVEPLLYRDGFSLYAVRDADGDRCFDCAADVTAGPEGIFVTDASDSVTVLKYHFFPYLKVIPDSLAITPIHLSDDPQPFIRVENGTVSSFAITNR